MLVSMSKPDHRHDVQRWRRLESLFEQAVALAPDEQDAFIDAECGPNVELANQLRMLLASGERSAASASSHRARVRRNRMAHANA